MNGRLRRAGVYNAGPDLSKLHQNDLRYTVDFRQIYTDLLTDCEHNDASSAYPPPGQKLR